MQSLADIVTKRQEETAEFKERKQNERDEVFTTLNEAVEVITTDPKSYAAYLEKQGQIPYYSAGNVILIMETRPEATRVGSMKFWNNNGRTVNRGETGIRILRSSYYNRNVAVQNEVGGQVQTDIQKQAGRGYDIASVFDIVQTHGKDLPPDRVRLQQGTDNMKAALTGLIKSAGCKMEVDETLTTPAFYDEKEMVLYVQPEAPDEKAFQALVGEITHSKLHVNAQSPDYDKDFNQIVADSVSYMMCKRYGVECETPDFSGIADDFGGLAHEDKLRVLNQFKSQADTLDQSIARELGPAKSAMENNSRVPPTRTSRPGR